MNLIMKAAWFADMAHQGQKRKYTGRPYIEHPGRVAARLSRYLPDSEEHVVAAAWLHDVLEDCAVTPETIAREFGDKVADMVISVTNPSKQHPELNRADRKAMDRAHIANISPKAKMLKLVDRTDNLLDSKLADQAFKELYVKESIQLYNECLRGVATELEIEFDMAIREAFVDAAVNRTLGK